MGQSDDAQGGGIEGEQTELERKDGAVVPEGSAGNDQKDRGKDDGSCYSTVQKAPWMRNRDDDQIFG